MSTAFDKLNDDSNFDESGMVKPITPADGATGTTNEPPANAENTAASQTPPPAEPSKPAGDNNSEEKSGEDISPAPKSTGDGTQPPPQAADQEETEDQLKERFSKPTDKTGEEWRIRAFREGRKLEKKLTPIQTHLEKIGSSERASRGLDFVQVFAEVDQPIADAVQKMTALSSSRTQELRNHIYNETLDNHPDVVARDLVEDDTVTVAELKEALQVLRGGTRTSKDAQPQTPVKAATGDVPKPEGLSDSEWDDFKIDYPEVYKAMQAAGAAPPAEPEPVDPALKELQTKVQTFEEKERTEAINKQIATIDAEGQKIYEKSFSVVTDRLRELGLEPDAAKDDERTVKIKTKACESIKSQLEAEFEGPNGPEGWEDWSLCTEEQKENRTLEAKVITLLAKGDFVAANDYVDIIQGRIDLILDRVLEPELDVYEAALRQPTEPTRNGKQDYKRPEIIGGSNASAGNTSSKTPWLEPGFKQPGESSFEAMSRYLQDGHSLPGR